MKERNRREIPYNYTSADDAQIVTLLLGEKVWAKLESLQSQRITGRSARLLMRFIGDMFILRRNPFLYQELLDTPIRRRRFLSSIKNDLDIVEENAGNPDVVYIIKKCREYLKHFEKEFSQTARKRRKILKEIGDIAGKQNVFFDPFTLISHSTDATDWRLHLPLAVIRPAHESHVAPIIRAIEKLNLKAIPRGAGTGLTGGCVPVNEDCVMINMEKLNAIRGIREREFTKDDGTKEKTPVLNVETGVITESAIEYAAQRGLVFATDPTSAWAATIGGNIAENAGGKTAVLWGTAIDNLLSYRITMPGGKELEVRRTNHPLRKILPDDTVRYEIKDRRGASVRTIELKGSEIRKKGLWKDITNKTLKGVPGIQKEGTDGIITSAEFVLYKAYEHKITACLEFFGDDMEEASRVIVEISKEFKNNGEEALMALEHFDDEYIKAINYKVKAPLSKIPKAVLLIDIVGHTEEQAERGEKRLDSLLEKYENTCIFFAKDQKESQRFWQDRKKLGAIAARTNAFKLNEDIVLPLEALAEFAKYADDYNIEENRFNQKDFVYQVLSYLYEAEPIEDPEWLDAKIPTAKELCKAALDRFENADKDQLHEEIALENLIDGLMELFTGYKRVSAKIREIHDEVRSRQIIIATHMHAGDGNVHVNIPVFSNDREMMQRANKTADDIMEKAVDLGGVVSGEHGIGITKMKYFDSELLKELTAYRKTVDPSGIMNPGKLSDTQIIKKVFTPSFNLLELEARILQHGSLETLAAKIAPCVRCGKCKVDCCTFYPQENLFFHPRNKNLAIASLIEALLYDAQRSHSARFKALKHLGEIADHCTICHKCYTPCPVNIDTGEVSILEREILGTLRYKHTPLATKMVLGYLQSRSQILNSVFRKAIVTWGSELQRAASRMIKNLPDYKSVKSRGPLKMLEAPIPPVPGKPLHSVLPPCSPNEAQILEPASEALKTVFYFPGCGSERLFSDISKASIYILLKSGVRVVLPPPFLCCGFPAKVNANTLQHSKLTLRDTIIFSQIREMLGYLTFDACVISCGTCREALVDLDTEEIFDCKVMDVSHFVLENGLHVKTDDVCLYHAPCHDSMNGKGAQTLEALAGYTVTPTPHCCSEAGTMVLSRPDITNAMRKRKTEAISRTVLGGEEKVVLTNCPSCIQGLGRNAHLDIIPRHIAVDLAIQTGGENWEEEFMSMVTNSETVKF